MFREQIALRFKSEFRVDIFLFSTINKYSRYSDLHWSTIFSRSVQNIEAMLSLLAEKVETIINDYKLNV